MATPITVQCPNCNNRMRASSEHIGQQGRCPACRALVEIQPVTEQASLDSLHPQDGLSRRQARRRALATTDVPAWQSAPLGIGLTTLLYLAIFWPLRHHSIGQLFLERGFVPLVTTLVTCWGLAILVLKYLAVRQQRSYAELELQLIPLSIGVQITPTNVDNFLSHLDGLPAPQRASVLGRRIQGALEHFRARTSVPEVQQYLTTQSEIDASQVDSGYSLLRAFIWAIPILGFIGTVIGISSAVAGLDVTMSAESGGDGILQGMRQVTEGLSTAFDTTLIALCMAILLLFPTEALRTVEYRMLDRIESFANESLLRRMSDEHEKISDDDLPEVVRRALDGAFQEHQRWLAQWQTQVAQLGAIIGADFETALGSIHKGAAQAEATRLDRMQQLHELLSAMFDQAGHEASTRTQSIETLMGQLEHFVNMGQQLLAAMTENSQHFRTFFQIQTRALEGTSADAIGNHLATPERTAADLDSTRDVAQPAHDLPTVTDDPSDPNATSKTPRENP